MKPLIHILFALCELLAAACYGQARVEYSFSVSPLPTATTPKAGDTITVSVYVRDLRPAGTWTGTKYANGRYVTGTWPLMRGVFESYHDLTFNAAVLVPQGCTFNLTYPNGQNYEAANGVINDCGGFAGAVEGLGTARTLLAQYRFFCMNPGDCDIVPSFDCESPAHLTYVYGNDQVPAKQERSLVSADEIKVVPLTITVR